jgi:hypothetical protein
MAAPFKNKNLVGEPELTSGETTQSETKFEQSSNLIKPTDFLEIAGKKFFSAQI